MARLWWYATLTYDPERGEEGYELTKVLLSYLNIAQQLLERNFGRAPHIRAGFLEYMRDNYDSLGATAGAKREHSRFLAERLNLRGGKTLLDTLDSDGVYDFLTDESQSYPATAGMS